MANIDDAVLARRQKDVEGFTEYYQGQLDKAVGDRAKELIPMWQRLKFKMDLQIRTLYAEAGATSNLDKATSLAFKADRVETLKKQIENDLRTVEAQQQPYYTEHLEYEYEQSYYSHAWGLEQAAQVNVNVPLLSTAQGLGVVANPWLEDGATYSDRIRANNAYLAQKMKDTVEEAVGTGYTVNEAARKLQECTDEGYFNSVRLMRTELNRAASQGASALFMQNADILDDKRWNATLDARTAPKDAANDDERFELDYDTPVNPGVPGKRIPNHPHCRCKYSPVLSALGVSAKERIARGAGDTKDNFGERIYTKARNYREYAKERGLPDLDARLARDNPTSYLRPGETVESIDKKVIRKSFDGKAVTVPKPLWETAQAEQSTTSTAKVSEPVKEKVIPAVKAKKTGHATAEEYFGGTKVKPDAQIEIMRDTIAKTTGVTHSLEDVKEMKKAIEIFSSSRYKAIRSAQMTGEGTEEITNAAKLIDKFIDVSPKWNNKETLFRGMKIAKSNTEFIESLKKGNTLNMQGSSSWSSKSAVAKAFAKDGKKTEIPVIFHLDKTNKGTSIKHLSKHQKEDEVLLSSTANFKISKVEDNYGTLDVWLKELP